MARQPPAAERAAVPLRSLIVDVQPMPQSVVGAIRVDAELAMFSQQPERAWSHLQCFMDHADLYDPVRSAAALAVGAAAATALDRRVAGAPRVGKRQSLVRDAADGLRVTRMLAVWMPLIDAELADGPEEWSGPSPPWPEMRPRRPTWCRMRSCAGPVTSRRPGSARPPVPS